ncbi:MAG: DUF72 domain-containing protein [Sulfolobales archaeon]
MKYFVGTSGWLYPWNPRRSFDWYVQHSCLNAVELNMSFYRHPLPNMVRAWALKGRSLKWSVKVSRLITHNFKLSEKAFNVWRRFRELFEPLDPYISFYLFQLPPSITPKSKTLIERFIVRSELGGRFALEVRNLKWFDINYIKWASQLGITWVSVDSPDFPRDIINTNGTVYIRMHGRNSWYSHYYTDEELKEVVGKVLATNPEKVFIFFNNNHDMLENARRMLNILNVMSNHLS